ncbi:hypothetical protein A6X21_19390 [Planctopirus hydrillae]|uniref:Uncharacterized protein n=1 Tax=Planctopirus hydrillae TaxID=1841610 RepID=A0A1C3EH09_9PLAN|nr:hypothetical protein A6X21_19390 [Planctopirus hydrillae]
MLYWVIEAVLSCKGNKETDVTNRRRVRAQVPAKAEESWEVLSNPAFRSRQLADCSLSQSVL